MRLTFEYSNGIPTFSATVTSEQVTPVELLVSDTGSVNSRRSALRGYIKSLEYLVSGVANYATGEIMGVTLENNWFGRMQKRGDAVTWEAVVDKLFVVLYHLSVHGVTERLYVADAFEYSRTHSDLPNPLMIKELLDPTTKAGRAEYEHTLEAVATVTEYVSNYSLVYGYNGKPGLVVLSKATGKPVMLEDIDNDDDFAIIRLLASLLGKGLHHGIFFIEGRGFRDRTIEAFVEIAKRFFGNTFIFLYNCSPRLSVNRSTIVLPNFVRAK